MAAVHRAAELGITFFDTADVYGAGHSERILARALVGHRDEAVIATKFGYTFDPDQRAITGQDTTPAYIRRACQASLRRLGTEWIDLYQLHPGDLPVAQALEVGGTLEELVAEGLIRCYGWSTDEPQRVTAFAAGAHCAAIQHELNVLADAPAMLAACHGRDLASISRGPLAMGLLTGKYGPGSQLPADDVRAAQPWVGYFTPWPRARCAGYWPAARAPSRSLASGPWPRPSRMPRRCAWARCPRRRWTRSPGCSTGAPCSQLDPQTCASRALDLERTPAAMLGSHERQLLA